MWLSHGTASIGSSENCEGVTVPRGTSWQKSSFSGNGVGNECLEIGTPPTDGMLRLRESDDPGMVLRAKPPALSALFLAIKAGRLLR